MLIGHYLITQIILPLTTMKISSAAILTTRSLKQDFDLMIENEYWESHGYETEIRQHMFNSIKWKK